MSTKSKSRLFSTPWNSQLGKRLSIALLVLAASTASLFAQQPDGLAPLGQDQGQNANQSNVVGSPKSGSNLGSKGGGPQADFDSLIDLIQSTVGADTWAENGTGEGQITPAINGVYVDAIGTLKFASKQTIKTSLRKIPQSTKLPSQPVSARKHSPLRYVSLNRLEAAIARRQSQHQPLTPEMLTLGGLQRIQYVMITPETGDLVIAGPAGNWQADPEGHILSTETGLPVVRLDDLLTLWRRRLTQPAAAFGCSISPRQASLAKTQAYLSESNQQPIEPTQREDWLAGLRQSLGKQDVEFFGLAAESHVARVLLVADYHMKLIGMGIAESVEGVSSYLDTVELDADGNPPSMAVLRWWFAMNYQPVETDQDRNIFQLCGPAVQVLSENELLAAHGKRVPTGQSDDLNRSFATSFTAEFDSICQQYPLYTELRNVFDLEMVLAIIQREGLVEQVGWSPTLFSDGRRLALPAVRVPQEVDTVVSHRIVNRRHIVAGISGGVWLDPEKSLKIRVSSHPTKLTARRPTSNATEKSQTEPWWWD